MQRSRFARLIKEAVRLHLESPELVGTDWGGLANNAELAQAAATRVVKAAMGHDAEGVERALDNLKFYVGALVRQAGDAEKVGR